MRVNHYGEPVRAIQLLLASLLPSGVSPSRWRFLDGGDTLKKAEVLEEGGARLTVVLLCVRAGEYADASSWGN